MKTVFYAHILRTQRNPIIIIIGILGLLLYSFATGGFRFTDEIDIGYQFNLAIGFLPIIVLFGIALLLSSTIMPEQQYLIEIHATQPYGYRLVIQDKVIVSFLTIIVLMLVYLLGAVVLMKGTVDTELVVTFIGCVIFLIVCTGLVLFAIIAGRDARLGQIGALLLFILLTQISVSDSWRIISPITFRATDLSSSIWWIARICYSLVGIGFGLKALRIASNTDYLLIGASYKRHKSSKFLEEAPSQSIIQRITKDLSLQIAITIYEAFIILRQGFILILFGMMGVFSVLVVAGTIREMGFTNGTTYHILSTTYSLTIMGMIFLPFLMIDAIWRDAESVRLDMRLSVQSHRQYLGYKAMGISLAMGISVTLGAILPYILGMIASTSDMALLGNFTVAYWGIVLFGLLPGAIYLSVMGFFIGAIFYRIPVAILRGVAIIVCIVLQLATIRSLVGNIVYPTGMMASTTTEYWYRQFLSVIFVAEEIPETVVFTPILMIPILSAIIQIGMLWVIASRIFAHTTRQR